MVQRQPSEPIAWSASRLRSCRLRLQQVGQAAIVNASKQQLCRDRAQKSGEHVPLRVPHVALRTKEGIRGVTARKRGPPLEELVARTEREARRRHEDEQPAAGSQRRGAQQDLADQDRGNEALGEVPDAVVIVPSQAEQVLKPE